MKTAETLRIAKRLGILLVLSFTLLASLNSVSAQWGDPCPWCAAERENCYDSNDQLYDSCANAAGAQKDACLSNSTTNYNSCVADCNFFNPPPQGCLPDCQTEKNTRDATCNSDYDYNINNCGTWVDYAACDQQETECRRDCE